MFLAGLILGKLLLASALFAVLYYYPMQECVEVQRGGEDWSRPAAEAEQPAEARDAQA